MNRPDDRFFDPLIPLSNRPRRIPALIGLRDSGRIPQVFTHRAFIESNQARIGEPRHHVSEPMPHEPAYDSHDVDPTLPPQRILDALTALVAHAHKPGSVDYSTVGAAGDLCRDYFDLDAP